MRRVDLIVRPDAKFAHARRTRSPAGRSGQGRPGAARVRNIAAVSAAAGDPVHLARLVAGRRRKRSLVPAQPQRKHPRKSVIKDVRRAGCEPTRRGTAGDENRGGRSAGGVAQQVPRREAPSGLPAAGGGRSRSGSKGAGAVAALKQAGSRGASRHVAALGVVQSAGRTVASVEDFRRRRCGPIPDAMLVRVAFTSQPGEFSTNRMRVA